MTNKEVEKIHKYAIWQSKDGKFWHTTFADTSKTRGIRQVKRSTKEELYRVIKEWYTKYPDGIRMEDSSLNDIGINEKKIIVDDFSKSKDIDILDIKKGLYSINAIGEIYSKKKKQPMVTYINNQHGNYFGQEYVKLTTEKGGTKFYSVAKLVLWTFVGPPPQNMVNPTVDHIDFCSINNYFRNLRWLEREENSSYHLKLDNDKYTASESFLVPNQVTEICNALIKNTASIEELSVKYNVSTQVILDIKQKKSWKYITTWFDFE